MQCSIFSHDSGLPLFVGNIPEESDDDSLLKLFDHHGQIDRAFVRLIFRKFLTKLTAYTINPLLFQIVRDADGRSKGFGFVEYCLESAVRKILLKVISSEKMKLDLSIFFLQMREAENDISRYSRLGLFVERAMVRDFHISQAVSLAVLELPIRSLQVYKQEHRDRTLDFIPDVLQEARRTLFDLFRHYGKILGHYVDLQRCQAFVDFSVSQEADSGGKLILNL